METEREGFGGERKAEKRERSELGSGAGEERRGGREDSAWISGEESHFLSLLGCVVQ